MSASEPYRLESFRGLTGFRHARERWIELLGRSAASPFANHPDWLEAHLLAFGTPDRLRGWAVQDGSGRDVGMFAFVPESSRGPLSLPRLRPVGDGTFDSDDLEPLAVRGAEEIVARAVADVCRRQLRPAAVVLDQVDGTSPMIRSLIAEFERRGAPPRVHPGEAGVSELGASLEATLAGLASRMRSKVRQALRRCEAAEASFDACESAARIGEFRDQLVRLHGLRWQAAGESGAFADTRRLAFYERLLPAAFDRGTLALTRLSIGDQPVALQLGFVEGDRYIQLQEGYDPAYSEQRVGVALRARSLEWLIARGVRVYDFLAGYTRHKRDWGAQPRSCPTLALPTGSPLGRLQFAIARRRDG